MKEKGNMPAKYLNILAFSLCIFLGAQGVATAGGSFGPLQPISKGTGGLHTGIGYWYQEDTYKDGAEYVMKQHQVYSELGYGFRDYWDVYGRIGLATLRVSDVFRSASPTTTTAKNDFEDNWTGFATLGTRGYYPISRHFGLGAFIQGTYTFADFADNTSGMRNGSPYTAELSVKKMYDIKAGVGLQATAPCGLRLYGGPYAYHAEAKFGMSAAIPGLAFSTGDVTMKNRTGLGGYAGIDLPLAKGFRLNMEGQYADRLSAGVTVTYSY